MKNLFFLTLVAAALVFAGFPGRADATVLIDNDFGGGSDIGPAFQGVSNGMGTGGSGDPATGLISTATANPTNSTRGLNNVSLVTVPIGTTSITATFEVSGLSTTLGLGSNGLYFGIVSGTDATATDGDALYNNVQRSFGFNPNRATDPGPRMFQRLNTTFNLTGFAPMNASYQDGFTAAITVTSNNTWSITTTGLSTNADGTGVFTGSLSGLTFATFISGGVGLNSSLQANDLQSVDLSRATLVAVPEPAAIGMAAAGVAILGFSLARLRRQVS